MNKKNNDFDQQSEYLDVWGMVVRHYPIILLNLVVFGVLGAIYCLKAEKVYEAKAEVLIEEKLSPVFNEQTMKDRPTFQNEVETHMLVLKSQKMFDAADEQAGIKDLKEFQDLDAIELIEQWNDNLRIAIPEDNANVLTVAYRGKNPEECQAIVSSVLEAYESHLKSKSAGLGAEVSKLVNEAKDELLGRLNNMETEYAGFRRDAPVLWKEGEAVNLHNERQIDLESRRKELMIEQSITEAKLSAILKALESGSKSARDAIYYEALIELQRADEKDQHIEREAARGYSQELSREYMQLAMEEKRMAAEFGAGHPDLKVLRVRLREMKTALKAALGDENNSSQIGGEKVDYVVVYTRLLAERISSFKSQIERLDAAYRTEEVAGTEIEDYLTEDERHRSNISRTQTLFDAVVARLEEINIIQDYGGETMEVIASASTGELVWPSIPIIAVLSTMLGLLFGGGWALLREITDRVFRNPSEIRNMFDVPVLGQIPKIKKASEIDEEFANISPIVATLHDGHSRFAESFRGVRTALQFSNSRSSNRVIQITSPLPGDGKSTIAANLAALTAKSGKRVLIVDADMRRPQVHKIFGQDVEHGLADILAGTMEIPDVIKESGVDGLSVMTAGFAPENPAELLTRVTFEETLALLKEDYDFVIVDTPPILAVSDPCIISTRVDGVILAMQMRKGVRQIAAKAKEIFDGVDSNLIGVVVNGVGDKSRKSSYGYDYGYGYGYGYTGSNKYYEAADVPTGKASRRRKSNGKKTTKKATTNGSSKNLNGGPLEISDAFSIQRDEIAKSN